MNRNQINALFVETLGERRGFYPVQAAIDSVLNTPEFAFPRFKDRRHTIEFYNALLTKTNLSNAAKLDIAERIENKQPLTTNEARTVLKALVNDAYKTLPPVKRGRKSREPIQQLAISINAELYRELDERARQENTTKTAIVENALKEFLSK